MLGRIFAALLLDILSFTLILPLLPRLLKFYQNNYLYDSSQDPLFGLALDLIGKFRQSINASLSSDLDIVLIGGFVGSLFSFLQFLAAPWIGALSDTFGRRLTLLISMIGNILSAAIWIVSDSFGLFLLSRIVGGLSEGNVQLSISMITDITNESTRSKGLALVGIAFALGFTLGPALGAFMSVYNLATIIPSDIARLYHLNEYSAAGFLSLSLLLVETLFIWMAFDETLVTKDTHLVSNASDHSPSKENIDDSQSYQKRGIISFCMFLFLFLFSGTEFTLTFLMFDRFGFTNMQQGKLLGSIGILSSIIQGGFVRRMSHKIGELSIAKQGLVSATLLACTLAVVGTDIDYISQMIFNGNYFPTLVVAVILFAFTSGTVVNSLTALYSLSIPQSLSEKRGEFMGHIRSIGQLGRSLGPIAACTLYWLLGSIEVYFIIALGMALVLGLLVLLFPQGQRHQQDGKKKLS